MGKIWRLCCLDVDIVVLLWEVTGSTGGFRCLRGHVRCKLARAVVIVFRCGWLGSDMWAFKDAATAEIYRGWLGVGG